MKNTYILGGIVAILVVGGLVFYARQSASPSPAANTKTEKTTALSDKIGVFENYKYNAQAPSSTDSFELYNFTQGKSTTLFELSRTPDTVFTHIFKNNNLLYAKDGNLFLVKLPDTHPLAIAQSVKSRQFVFSQNAKDLFYVTHENEGDTLYFYKYSIATGEKKVIATIGKAISEELLGSNATGDELYFTQAQKLYVLKNGQSELLYEDKKIASDPRLGALYNLSPDASKVLVSTTATGPAVVTAVGIFDIAAKKYTNINSKLHPYLANFLDVSGFTEDSKNIYGYFDEGYGKYTYWTLNLETSKFAKLFSTDKGLLVSTYPDQSHFLVRKDDFLENRTRGRVSYFIQPELAPQNLFVVDSEKANGDLPNLLFVGWFTN